MTNFLFAVVGAMCLITCAALAVNANVEFSVRIKQPAPVYASPEPLTPKQYVNTARGASRAFAMDYSR